MRGGERFLKRKKKCTHYIKNKANELRREFIVRALVDMKFSSQKQQKLCSCNGLHGFHNFFFPLSFFSFFLYFTSPPLTPERALSSSDTHVTRASLNSRPCFIFVSVFIIDFSLSHTAGSCRALFACLFVMEWFAFLYAKKMSENLSMRKKERAHGTIAQYLEHRAELFCHEFTAHTGGERVEIGMHNK